jgi:riboflavin synthase
VFSGIVERLCEVRQAQRGSEGMRLQIELGPLAEGVSVGDSIAVNGACLTVTGLGSGIAAFDVVSETLARTTLTDIRTGARVNIERPLRVGDRLHGHLVQGHVDGVGRIARIHRGPEGGEVAVECAPTLTDEMIPKGSVAVDGISLTIKSLDESSFSVAIIPHTMGLTTLGIKQVGDKVNIEADMIGKWVKRILGRSEGQARPPEGVTMERLKSAGFV